MRKSLLIHPFLFGAFPILFIFTQNANEIFLSDISIPLVIAIFCVAFLGLVFFFALRNAMKVAVALSVFLILFSIYGLAYNALEHLQFGPIDFSKHKYLVTIWSLIFFLVVFRLMRSRNDLEKTNKVFTFMAISLVVSSLLSYGFYKWNNYNKVNLKEIVGEDIETGYRLKEEEKRDIYYIILDGYANDETLRTIYHYDNSDLLNFLGKNNFRVTRKSRSNHSVTFLSLASSLNMMYDTILRQKAGELSNDRVLPYRMIKQNKVMKFLLANGYHYVHTSSGWGPTNRSIYADQNVSVNNEFVTMLVRTTMLTVFSNYFTRKLYREKMLYTFDQLENHIPKIKGPKFVFAHLLIPHMPYLFKENGDKAKWKFVEDHDAKWEYKEDYLNQLKFTNTKVKTMVRGILANSKKDPIIIIQSDHGPGHTFINYQAGGGWDNPSEVNIKEKMRILNAYHLPEEDNGILYDTITPVNTFRLIFNHYFHTKLDLKDDQSFYSNNDRPFKFINVTSIARFDQKDIGAKK